MSEIFDHLVSKYKELGEDPKTYLVGLLYAKPLTYWDYIHTDTLLSLQQPKTGFKDETIFILYSQQTELFLKAILHELDQICCIQPSENLIREKIERCNMYMTLLIDLFKMMRTGIKKEDYHLFRNSLTPASGFQSVQFRFIELYATRLENLTRDCRLENRVDIEILLQHIYWRSAGINYKTGDKTLTLKLFEERYWDQLILLSKRLRGNTVEDQLSKFQTIPANLVDLLKTFDHLFNVAWPLTHLSTVRYFLIEEGECKRATGSSEWLEYLHPKYQQIKFFPKLWLKDEILDWRTK
ncbi:MAG: tryptophan 2,3-dioxygenase [Cyclobacteriaceae bacterium]|nr:tryptophan 2,3-dioxygenase [Cyclobacteriaceae bacterium SS2]